MSVVVVVKKKNEIVIASDTLTSMGSLRLSADFKENNLARRKFFEYNGTFIGSVGRAMTKIMLRHALRNVDHTLNCDGLDNIYSSLLELHKILKDEYYLVPGKGQGTAVENTNFHLLIANKSGIYEVTGDRYVSELSKFWAIGSGMPYALGAMSAVYDKKKYSAEDIARAGVEAACTFDKSCDLPMDLAKITLD